MVLVVELEQSNVAVIDKTINLKQLRPMHQIKFFLPSLLCSLFKSTQVSTVKGEDRNDTLINCPIHIWKIFNCNTQINYHGDN